MLIVGNRMVATSDDWVFFSNTFSLNVKHNFFRLKKYLKKSRLAYVVRPQVYVNCQLCWVFFSKQFLSNVERALFRLKS